MNYSHWGYEAGSTISCLRVALAQQPHASHIPYAGATSPSTRSNCGPSREGLLFFARRFELHVLLPSDKQRQRHGHKIELQLLSERLGSPGVPLRSAWSRARRSAGSLIPFAVRLLTRVGTSARMVLSERRSATDLCASPSAIRPVCELTRVRSDQPLSRP